ncbi:MAG TPA: diaminopimelate epimerase, partial [Candidatus Tumulicola sp.]|nr:diaminopimelate epimerase [Candidatus Tumulicola sp.]
MTAPVAITKMHGACNDFVVVDCRSNAIASLPDFARWVCNRHAGVGADGVIAIEASNGSRVAMRTINADGSEAEMCGNGARCAARWLDESGAGDGIEFDTAAGPVRAEIVARVPEYLVRVSVGTPRVADLSWEGERAYAVDLGNPHAVFFRERVDGV